MIDSQRVIKNLEISPHNFHFSSCLGLGVSARGRDFSVRGRDFFMGGRDFNPIRPSRLFVCKRQRTTPVQLGNKSNSKYHKLNTKSGEKLKFLNFFSTFSFDFKGMLPTSSPWASRRQASSSCTTSCPSHLSWPATTSPSRPEDAASAASRSPTWADARCSR